MKYRRDHPRACGEHCEPPAVSVGGAGSSPRLRGTRRWRVPNGSRRGIIPALAGNTACRRPSARSAWDHPRACGEHAGVDPLTLSTVGSSPRLRGTRSFSSSSSALFGIIPALAGNTYPSMWSSATRWDHPRACGEHLVCSLKLVFSLGSSPRLRGTLEPWSRKHTHQGIIPALAGNTLCAMSCMSWSGDHPRACGEHFSTVSPMSLTCGSSPRLRGTHPRLQGHGRHPGIIPALAGNTSSRRSVTSWPGGSSPRLRGTPGHTLVGAGEQGIIPALAGNTRQSLQYATDCGDHPRACGEHFTFNATIQPLPGSSPRLRGTQDGRVESWIRIGIIPALAGNTVTVAIGGLFRGDHPRACGEHSMRLLLSLHFTGSSPRLRGTRVAHGANLAQHGIIPALAGNTGIGSARTSSTRDHPRACGEHCCICDNFGQNMGSSPRLRGTRPYLYDASTAHGIIPALAGNTIVVGSGPRGCWDHPRACGEHTPLMCRAGHP